jgi:predicted nucleic-acid-binding protein
MIGLDTNILTRVITRDDAVQSPKANAILGSLSAEVPGWIGTAVLLEIVWVLTSNFRYTRVQIYSAIEKLLDIPELVIENSDTVRRATEMFGRGSADFADCLISASARRAGCSHTLTFDKDAAKSAGMTLVP